MNPFWPPSWCSSTATVSSRPDTSLNTPISTPSISSKNRDPTARSPPTPSLGIALHRLPRPGVERRDGPHQSGAVVVLEIQELIEVPVQVVGEVRQLLPERLGRVPHHRPVAGISSIAARLDRGRSLTALTEPNPSSSAASLSGAIATGAGGGASCASCAASRTSMSSSEPKLITP